MKSWLSIDEQKKKEKKEKEKREITSRERERKEQGRASRSILERNDMVRAKRALPRFIAHLHIFEKNPLEAFHKIQRLHKGSEVAGY